MSKLCPSTFFWAFSTARLMSGCSIGSPSSIPSFYDRRDPVGAEDPEQVVLEREVEARGARVPLPSRAAAQLVVHPAGLVALRADDVEPALPDDPFPSLMSTPRPAMLVAIVTLPECPASAMICASCSWCLAFRTLWGTPWRVASRRAARISRSRRCPPGPAAPARAIPDLLEDRLELLLLGPVDLVGEVPTDHRLVRRHDGYGGL